MPMVLLILSTTWLYQNILIYLWKSHQCNISHQSAFENCLVIKPSKLTYETFSYLTILLQPANKSVAFIQYMTRSSSRYKTAKWLMEELYKVMHGAAYLSLRKNPMFLQFIFWSHPSCSTMGRNFSNITANEQLSVLSTGVHSPLTLVSKHRHVNYFQLSANMQLTTMQCCKNARDVIKWHNIIALPTCLATACLWYLFQSDQCRWPSSIKPSAEVI